MKKLILAIIIAVLPIAANATQPAANTGLVKYYETTYNDYYMKPASITTNPDGTVVAWLQWKFNKPTSEIAMLDVKVKADCDMHSMYSTNAIAYDVNDDVVKAEKHLNKLVLSEGTANLATYEIVCERAGKVAK